MAEAGDILIQLHLHDAVLFQGVHGAGFRFTRLDKAQGLRNRHLKNQNLIFRQRRFRNAVTGLDQRRIFGFFGGIDARHALKELANRHGVGGVISPLVDDLQHVRLANDAGGQLNAAGTPAVWHGHFATAERHLITGDSHRFQNGAADHAFSLFIQISKVVAA